jgi:hypothetical protein
MSWTVGSWIKSRQLVPKSEAILGSPVIINFTWMKMILEINTAVPMALYDSLSANRYRNDVATRLIICKPNPEI